MNKTILIKNAIIATGGERNKILYDHSILIENDTIKKIDNKNKFKGKYSKVIDGQGKIAMPGLINTHMHFYSTFARGLIKAKPSKNFVEVLNHLWWRLDKKLILADCYYSAIIPLIDAIRKGTTTIIDHHASPFAIRGSLKFIEKAVREIGLRACLCYEVSDRDGKEKAKEGIKENVDFIKYACKKDDNFVYGLFGLHASFTISNETLEEAADHGHHLNVGFHIHAAESQSDQIHSETHYNLRVIERLQKFGIVGNKSICAHCVHINEKEMDILKHTQTAVVHNPQSNANNSVGIADIVKMSKKGILVGLGTDAMTVNMLEELRYGIWLQHLKNDPSVGFTESVWALLVNNGKIANRYFKNIGEIKEGNFADIILMDYNPPTPLTSDNFYGHLVFGISQNQVDTTIVNGRILMENKKLKIDIDENEIFKKSLEASKKLWNRF